MESGTHVALSRNRHCGRKASLGGHGDYTQADSQWENNRYKVTIHGCLKLCGGGWSRMHGSAAATVCFQCTFTTPKGNPTSLKQPPPPFFPPSHGPICLPAVSVLDGSATWHHTQLGPSLTGLSLKSSKRQHASTCPPLSSGGTGPGTTFNLLSLYHFSSPTVSPGQTTDHGMWLVLRNTRGVHEWQWQRGLPPWGHGDFTLLPETCAS